MKIDKLIDIELNAERWAKKVRWYRSRGLFETYQFISRHPHMLLLLRKAK